MTQHKRRIKLIKPSLQLKLVGTFIGLTALTLLLQYLLITAHLTDAATRMPDGGTYLMSITPEMLTKVLLLSFLVVLPLIFCVGVLTTFRIAGPVYRFEQYLGSIARGEEVGPCRLRKGDELCIGVVSIPLQNEMPPCKNRETGRAILTGQRVKGATPYFVALEIIGEHTV